MGRSYTNRLLFRCGIPCREACSCSIRTSYVLSCSPYTLPSIGCFWEMSSRKVRHLLKAKRFRRVDFELEGHQCFRVGYDSEMVHRLFKGSFPYAFYAPVSVTCSLFLFFLEAGTFHHLDNSLQHLQQLTCGSAIPRDPCAVVKLLIMLKWLTCLTKD